MKQIKSSDGDASKLIFMISPYIHKTEDTNRTNSISLALKVSIIHPIRKVKQHQLQTSQVMIVHITTPELIKTKFLCGLPSFIIVPSNHQE